MVYTDGNEARLGDIVTIDKTFSGVVVASIDNRQFSKDFPAEKWAQPGQGVLMDTDFGGLVHYQDSSAERIVLVRRDR